MVSRVVQTEKKILKKRLFGSDFEFDFSGKSKLLEEKIKEATDLFGRIYRSSVECGVINRVFSHDEKVCEERRKKCISEISITYDTLREMILSTLTNGPVKGNEKEFFRNAIREILECFFCSWDETASTDFPLFIILAKYLFEKPYLIILSATYLKYLEKIKQLLSSENVKENVNLVLTEFSVDKLNNIENLLIQKRFVFDIEYNTIFGNMACRFGVIFSSYEEGKEAAYQHYEFSAQKKYFPGMLLYAHCKLMGIGCDIDLNEAIKIYNELYKMDSKNPAVCLVLSQIYMGSNQHFPLDRLPSLRADDNQYSTKREAYRKKAYDILKASWEDIYASKIKKSNDKEEQLIFSQVGLSLGELCFMGLLGENKRQYGFNVLKQLSKLKVLQADFIIAKINFKQASGFSEVKKSFQELYDLFEKEGGKSISISQKDFLFIVSFLEHCLKYPLKDFNSQMNKVESCIDIMRLRFSEKFDLLLSKLKLKCSEYTTEDFVKSYEKYISDRRKQIDFIGFHIKNALRSGKSSKDQITQISKLIRNIYARFYDLDIMDGFHYFGKIVDCFEIIGEIIRDLGPNKTQVNDCLFEVMNNFSLYKEVIERTSDAKSSVSNDARMLPQGAIGYHCRLIMSIRHVSIFPEEGMKEFLESQLKIISRALPRMIFDIPKWALVIHSAACTGLSESVIMSDFLYIVSKFLKQKGIESYLTLIYYSLALLSVGDKFFKARDSAVEPYSEACREQINQLARKTKDKIETLLAENKLWLTSTMYHQIMMGDYCFNKSKKYFSKKPLSIPEKEEVARLLPDPTVSNFQKSVFSEIQNVFSDEKTSDGLLETLRITQETILGPLSRDIVVRVGGQKCLEEDETLPEETIIFEVNGPTHFVFAIDSNGELFPYKTPKHFLHEECLPEDVVVINIDYNEKLPNNEDREEWLAYLQEKVEAYADKVPLFIEKLSILSTSHKTSVSKQTSLNKKGGEKFNLFKPPTTSVEDFPDDPSYQDALLNGVSRESAHLNR